MRFVKAFVVSSLLAENAAGNKESQSYGLTLQTTHCPELSADCHRYGDVYKTNLCRTYTDVTCKPTFSVDYVEHHVKRDSVVLKGGEKALVLTPLHPEIEGDWDLVGLGVNWTEIPSNVAQYEKTLKYAYKVGPIVDYTKEDISTWTHLANCSPTADWWQTCKPTRFLQSGGKDVHIIPIISSGKPLHSDKLESIDVNLVRHGNVGPIQAIGTDDARYGWQLKSACLDIPVLPSYCKEMTLTYHQLTECSKYFSHECDIDWLGLLIGTNTTGFYNPTEGKPVVYIHADAFVPQFFRNENHVWATMYYGALGKSQIRNVEVSFGVGYPPARSDQLFNYRTGSSKNDIMKTIKLDSNSSPQRGRYISLDDHIDHPFQIEVMMFLA